MMIRMTVAASTVMVLGGMAIANAADRPFRLALEAQKSYVHCVNGQVSVEQWDEEQMHVRYGSNVCQLRSFTSSSSAQNWGRSNFPSGRCSC